MNQDDVERVAQGETRTFRPLHELLGMDIKVQTVDEMMRDMVQRLEGRVPVKKRSP